MEDYKQVLLFCPWLCVFLNPAHKKKSICDWHILQFGYDLWLLFLFFFFLPTCRRWTWKDDKALEIWTSLCFNRVFVQPLLVNPAMINELHVSLSKLFVFYINGFNVPFSLKQQATKTCHQFNSKISLKWNPRLISVSDFFNGKRVTENLS